VTPGLPGQVWPGDFNRDGITDLAGGETQVLVALGNGDGTFKTPLPVNGAEMVRAVADMNRDGFADIVAIDMPAASAFCPERAMAHSRA